MAAEADDLVFGVRRRAGGYTPLYFIVASRAESNHIPGAVSEGWV